MKTLNVSLLTLTTTCACLITSVSVANAFSVTSNAGLTDADFRSLLDSGQFEELFVAESRGGNNAPSGDYEQSINRPIPANGSFPGTIVQTNQTWESETPVDFTLAYDDDLKTVTYTVDGETLTATLPKSGTSDPSFSPNTLYLRTRAGTQNNNGSPLASVTLQNLVLNNVAISGLSSSSTSTTGDVDYLIISQLTSSFTLSGQQIFSWSGTFPTGSRLDIGLKVGRETPVPEPLTLLGSGIALGFGTYLKRKLS